MYILCDGKASFKVSCYLKCFNDVLYYSGGVL